VEFNTLKVVKWFPGISPATFFYNYRASRRAPVGRKSPKARRICGTFVCWCLDASTVRRRL